jgi:hypothetical protein
MPAVYDRFTEGLDTPVLRAANGLLVESSTWNGFRRSVRRLTFEGTVHH